MTVMATNARSLRTEALQAEQEVPLSGVLAEFRDALRAEIEAARKAAQSRAFC